MPIVTWKYLVEYQKHLIKLHLHHSKEKGYQLNEVFNIIVVTLKQRMKTVFDKAGNQ